MSERLLIIGGSVRAACMSARRAGFEPLAIDRFGDADLQRICPTFRRYDQLSDLPQLARQMPPGDWMYTGSLENHREVIAQVSQRHRLLGNNGTTLRPLRDPWCLATALRESGLLAPELSDASQVPAGFDWLRKPRRAAGGLGIARSGSKQAERAEASDSIYFQKFIAGRPIGATFLGTRGRAVLVGVTEQLLGPTWGGSREFQYAGSLGPLVLATGATETLTRIGECIAERFRVQGLFGVDAIVNEAGVWPVEVNPRYTASVEILERAFGCATIGWHVAACRDGELPDLVRRDTIDDGLAQYGKAVVYADRDIFINAQLQRALFERNVKAADPLIADIPMVGTNIHAAEPVVTVFATGRTSSDVEERLRTSIADVKRMTRDD